MIKKMVSLLFSLFIVCAISLGVFLLYLRTQALPATNVPQTSHIYDLQGEIIDSFYTGENREIISLDDVSTYVIQATLAVEDHRYFDHFGFDLKGVTRAAIVNLQNMDRGQGASTITQQLARNLYLTHEKTWTRKLKEAIYTIQLEMQYSKREILELYLNEIYYGHAAYGIQAAAQHFFSKDAKDLNLAESAIIAGIPKGPAYYSPFLDFENSKNRQYDVLQAMVKSGLITENEAKTAYEEELIFNSNKKTSKAFAPYFVDYIRQHAIDKLNISEEAFNQGGYQIYTTLDANAQKIAEEVIAEKMEEEEELQVALISIDPRNGYVKAMVGGSDYEKNQYNRVFANTRQPGSAFKPVLYLTALQSNELTAASQFKSEPTAFTYDDGKKFYMPSNFGDKYPNDYIDLRQAISQSDNIYAVHTIMQVGAEEVINTARTLGITSSMQPLPSLALGTYPVSPFEMAYAFGTIANQGVRAEPIAILQIEDTFGNVLYTDESSTMQVIDPTYTYIMTNLMKGIFDPGGTGHRVSYILNRPVAAKTGTTNTDAWMVGFTPELSTAVWVGYDKDLTISPVESMLASPIFAEYTERALEAIPPKLFPVPDDVVSVYIDAETGLLATSECPNSRLETFAKGTEPTQYCSVHLNHDDDPEPIQKEAETEESSWWGDLKRWWNN
ncbi:transglycosylase domain-containing protein [Chengkuizengella axinellae]|uniref:PBP1A family penicillin-binding protein n=1 Tax=Chengkuizengella axinellae TaxID=3064388 RepID=A0ABT9IZ73_9BACL|nr:PBP1A family penicillin-binding protein [Chengkuizengella sp. 2205SS18-9]MDP5274671.1 PBP1A family penicillin-binding protein [Chengkuizengella sp. 2205SS18-9]